MIYQLVCCLATLATLASSAPFEKESCQKILEADGFSKNFNETIAHALHSMTLDVLQVFNPSATEDNKIPTVNHDLRQENKVLPHAPVETIGHDFETEAMNRIDKILSTLGKPEDGLGTNWSPIERVAHMFHMVDLWKRIETVFKDISDVQINEKSCSCLLNIEENGIRKAVQWVADHYKTGTPITLLNQPIPKLVDANSWQIWKDRLLHYYTPQALMDAARYLQCTILEN